MNMDMDKQKAVRVLADLNTIRFERVIIMRHYFTSKTLKLNLLAMVIALAESSEHITLHRIASHPYHIRCNGMFDLSHTTMIMLSDKI